MGFWKALDEAFPGTRHQRCWVHKIANVLNKFSKSMKPTVNPKYSLSVQGFSRFIHRKM